MTVALYIDPIGPYPALLGPDQCWDEARDARGFMGPGPVVAHPPCARWSRLAASVYARLPYEKYRPGNDGGCFAAALAAVRRWGGVLEHPRSSAAFKAFGLGRPLHSQWTPAPGGWICEVWQSAYGHRADKATWLYYVGAVRPFELDWSRPKGTHVVGCDSKWARQSDAPRPKLSRKEAIHSPVSFAVELIRLADWSQGVTDI